MEASLHTQQWLVSLYFKRTKPATMDDSVKSLSS